MDEPITSQASDYEKISRHYMMPEEIEKAPYPPYGKQHAIYATAHALVSERHDKYDLVRMVYALLLKWEEEVAREPGAH
jgi:hypothetical protein